MAALHIHILQPMLNFTLLYYFHFGIKSILFYVSVIRIEQRKNKICGGFGAVYQSSNKERERLGVNFIRSSFVQCSRVIVLLPLKPFASKVGYTYSSL